MKTAAARFSALSAARTTVLDRAREASRLTIPGLVPEAGQNEHYTPTQPFQSIGSNGLRALSARLLATLFPVNLPFFRLELSPFDAKKVQADKAQTDALLSQVSESTSALMEERNVRPVMAELLRHLIVAGNAVAHMPLDGRPKLYRIDQFVLRRDLNGQWVEIIIQEKVYPSALPEDIRDFLGLKIDNTKQEEAIDLYTVVERRDDRVHEWQEAKGRVIPESEGDAPAESSGWIAPRWLAVPGSDYGRSHVTEYIGDLLSLEDLHRSINQFATLASRVLYMVGPNAGIDPEELARAETGDYIYGDAEDVTSVGLDKTQDFGVVRAVAETTEERVSRAFLIQSFRNAERVTAEEIRAQSEELENTLGGSFSVLASELQAPIATRYLYIAQALERIPPVPPEITPKVITGLAALGRAAEVNRLRTFIGDATTMLSNPAVTEHFNIATLLTRLGNEHGVLGLDDLLKSEEQKAEEMQAAMMQQTAMQTAPAVADAAMKAAMEQLA